ncbi:ribosome biogenesis GTPase [Psychromicrobium silvestre]|uniref:Small ribosomal subunit biogenesis GTPase RsgA n=1 Tax=Psychromicrobium silvestre TaxID=1645614 RepID=A0A7Y9LT44_9MICC|nr:ribosome small subunit-dependent GTPase A [Psychromicrobium silvestre]NYE95111.1 ribosome biogenesis GTPase [Psychromicrobium silvestre]
MISSSIGELSLYGFSDRIAELYRDYPGLEAARVVRADRSHFQVMTRAGAMFVPRALITPEGAQCATGDWLGLDFEGSLEGAFGANPGLLQARVLPRFSQLIRKVAFANSSESQLLAANIDLIAVVVPLDRTLSPGRIERMLVAAWDSGATPLLILTKADLADGINGNHDVVSQVMEYAAGVRVITTSAEAGDGIEEVRQQVQDYPGGGATLTFLGPSGAGKSTLINALIGAKVQDTGEVREGDFKGKHTTTARELVPLPGGGVLMDTPGVRGFEVVDAAEGVAKVFGDIEELFGLCRFADCQHLREPGCAVQEALENGLLESRRWQSYQKMQREMARLAQRKDIAQSRSESRSAGRAYRSYKKIRGRVEEGKF